MRFCMPHWNALREEIEVKQNLARFVSSSGKEVLHRTVGQLSDPTELGDPLMTAHNMIVGNAIQQGGLYLLAAKPDGSEYCPLCEAAAHFPNGEEGARLWIEFAGRDTAQLWADHAKANPEIVQ